jgi:hypothetical protein
MPNQKEGTAEVYHQLAEAPEQLDRLSDIEVIKEQR